MDCFVATNATFSAFKLHEVAKYLIDIDLGAINAFWLAMNRTRFLALPRNVQTLLKTAGAEASEYGVTITKEAEDGALKTMDAAGVRVVRFEDQAAFGAAIPDMTKVWIDSMDKAGRGPEARTYAQQLKDLLAKN
jgi:TRAP-type C4-dicarboxylate transport system substrate-binding protein